MTERIIQTVYLKDEKKFYIAAPIRSDRLRGVALGLLTLANEGYCMDCFFDDCAAHWVSSEKAGFVVPLNVDPLHKRRMKIQSLIEAMPISALRDVIMLQDVEFMHRCITAILRIPGINVTEACIRTALHLHELSVDETIYRPDLVEKAPTEVRRATKVMEN